MRRQPRLLAVLALMLGVAAHFLLADESPVALPEFRVEGTPWLYAKTGDMEILSRAAPRRAQQMAAALARGKRLFPDFFLAGRSLPLLLIVVDSPRRPISGLPPATWTEASEQNWPSGYQVTRESYVFAGENRAVCAINLGTINDLWLVLTNWAHQAALAQRPAFAEWVTTGALGVAGPLSGVIGIRHTTSIRFPRLSWPDAAVPPGEFPSGAGELPDFATMFDPARKAASMSPTERTQFQFQTALFARWSLFGPAKNGRNRNGYWAFAELARRNGAASEEVFLECYGMDWAQACAEMRAYLKPQNVGMLEVRMPHVMADVPEVDAMEFRDATLEEVRRILGEFNRLRTAEEAARGRTKEGAAPALSG